jgi:Fur family ferric uptake transcriptional regulator
MPFSTDEVIRDLQARGERVTMQRRMVLEIVGQEDHHFTVQEVQQRLHQRDLILPETTVYRILQWLKEVGIVSQTDLGQRGIVYQRIGAPPHHHLICLSCGAVLDMPDDLIVPLRDYLRQTYDFEPRLDHMAFFGLCHVCRQ